MSHPDEPWEMLCDKKIWAMLADPDRQIDPDHTRLMFIELFSRIKNLELENNTLKVLMFQCGFIDEKVFFDALAEVKDFFKEWDEEKAREVDFYESTGISFVDWAAFTSKGKFDRKILNN